MEISVGNCPFSSLISAVIIFVGVGVFCGTLYRALQLIINGVMGEVFQFKVSWLEVIQVVFIVIAVAMAVYAIILVIFGFLATGATRRNVYTGAKCIMGGKVSAGFFMAMSWFLTLAWIVIMSTAVIPVIFYVSTNSICSHEVYNKDVQQVNYCFRLSHYGIYRNSSYTLGIPPPGKSDICEPMLLKRMCDKVAEAGPLFCVAYAGAFLIVLGLVFFMVTTGVNYTLIKTSKELTEYRDAIDIEELELSRKDSR